MKKLLSLLSLFAFGAALTVGVAGFQKESKDVGEADAYELHDLTNDKFIPVSPSTIVSDQFNVGDQIRGNSPRFWTERYYGTTEDVLDTVDINGATTGEFRTHYFSQQSGKYISFLLGGNMDDCFVNIFVDGKGDVVDHIRNPYFQDPSRSLNMCFRYFKIETNQEFNRTLLFLRDDNTGHFCGGITFSELRINQTWDEVVESYRNFLLGYKLSAAKNSDDLNAYNKIMELHNSHADYADLKSAIDGLPSLTNVDDDFETPSKKLVDWVVDWNVTTNYYNKETIYSNATHKVDGYFVHGMPFNQHGSYFLNEDANGFPEVGRYRLVSREFSLGGVGLISAKLGGATAVLELLDADTLEVLATTDSHGSAEGEYVCNPGFSWNRAENARDDLDMFATGERLNTLTRVYLDCSAFLNSATHTSFRVALNDGRTGGGWGKAYFDDVKTYYASYPTGFNAEAQSQDVGENVTHYGVVTDRYVGDVTNLAFGKAYAFVREFWDTVRSTGSEQSWCSHKSDSTTAYAALITKYNALGNAQTYADASTDYTYVSNNERTAYLTSPINVTDFTVGSTMGAIISGNYPSSSLINGNLFFGTQENSTLSVIVIVTVIAMASLCALVVLKKKRKSI